MDLKKYTYIRGLLVGKDKMCEIDINHVEPTADSDGFLCNVFTMPSQRGRNTRILQKKNWQGFFNPIFWSVFRQCFLISGERESLRLLFKAVFVACGTLFSKSTNYFCPKENTENKSHKNAMNVPQPNKHCVVQQSRARCSSKYLAYQWYFSRTNIVDLDELKDVPFL